jgi:hypothetical protein
MRYHELLETENIIDVTGLSEDNLGYPKFPQEFVTRRDWCEENCKGAYDIQPIRDSMMRLTGRSFRFQSHVDAVLFKLRFETRLT